MKLSLPIIKEKLIATGGVPSHVAFIMDGNGRWAKKRLLPRHLGHKEGFFRIMEVARLCQKMGIRCMSLFAFSTENWKRPQEEIDHLFNYLDEFVDRELPNLIKDQCRVVVSGDLTRLPAHSQIAIDKALKATAKFDKFILNVCLNYGGQAEIVRAAQLIAVKVSEGKIKPTEIDQKYFESFLYTKDLPPVDLLIRTSGEQRISNFMMYQLAYSEIVFHPSYWPDFKEQQFLECLEEYLTRSRRFGGV